MGVATDTDLREAGVCPQRLARIAPWMDRLVADGRLAGLSVSMQRRGKTVFARACGQADLARGTPFTLETVTRIYSMTKPLTSVAVMQLYEQGHFQLDDPVSRFLPEFKEMRVAVGGNRAKIETEPAKRPITVRDLLTHTAGLTYGFMEATLVDASIARRASTSWPARAPSPRCRRGRPRRRCSPSPARPGTTASPPTCSAISWRSSPAAPSRITSARR